jgi:hypothetical protein
VIGTMIWAAMDVHARSTDAASLDVQMGVQTGVLTRCRFDTGAVSPSWSGSLGCPGRCAAATRQVRPGSACIGRRQRPCSGIGSCIRLRISALTDLSFACIFFLVAAGLDCQVIAPSNAPHPPVDRNKSDRRDTDLLLRPLMAGALTPIAVPSVRFERPGIWPGRASRQAARAAARSPRLSRVTSR